MVILICRFQADVFAPIITINESPKQADSKILRPKKLTIKVEPNEGGEIVFAQIVKRKRGRPKKINSDSEQHKKKKSKKKSKDRNKEKKRSKKPKDETKQLDPKPIEPVEHLVVKSEPFEDNTAVEIKTEIKEEPEDDLPVGSSELDDLKPVLEDVKNFKCPLCVKESKDETEYNCEKLREHYKQKHPGKRLRQSKLSSLESFPCDICGKEFRSASAVKDHIETHNNYYYCEFCNASQKRLLDYIIHKRAHSEIGKFQCAMCEFQTEDINGITDHVNNHDETLRYWCEQCKKGFEILSWFTEHDNYHTGLKPFICEFCDKCFLYSRYLHAHKVNFHTDEVNFPTLHECVICHKQYQHKNSLKLHMNTHTGNYSICDICGKMLSSKEKLKFHIRIHTGYKPYSCAYCDKSFTKKPILVEHTRIHTGERPYVCEYCNKAFSQRSSLVIHIRGHTGEKPYVCQFCSKGFVAKAMLNVHLKTCKGLLVVPHLGFH